MHNYIFLPSDNYILFTSLQCLQCLPTALSFTAIDYFY